MALGRNGSHNYKPSHHYGLSNEVKTLDGTQAKRGIKFLENSKKSPGLKEAATVFKGNVLNYSMAVKRIKFKFIQI